MRPAAYLPVPVLLVFFTAGGTSYKCTDNGVCKCLKFKGKLLADCSDRNLTTAPVFLNDVIGINFAKNRFTKVPQNLPAKLLYLDISQNKLVALDSTSFARYRLMQNLSVSANRLREVSIGTFQSNPNLKHLDMSFNRLLTLEVMFNVSIDLKNSTIKTLNFEKLHCTYGVSQIMKHYHVIHLKHTKLQELNIASNRICSLELGVLSDLPKSLLVLNMADNVLSFGFYLMEFSALYNLEILNVSFQDSFHQVGVNGAFSEQCNDTRTIPCICSKGGVVYIKEREYETEYKNHSIFDGSNKNRQDTVLFPNLIERDMGRFLKPAENYTVYLPRNLRKLYYHNNLYKMSITKFPFSLNNRLTHMFAQQNIIYELIGPVTGLFHLKYADLSGNFCKFIAKTFFRSFTKLEYLNLSNNALSQTFESDTEGDLFFNQGLLSIVDISLNRITHLPKRIFQNNIYLRKVDLSFNSLTKFEVKIDHMTNLSDLDLSNNQLSQLNLETRNSLDQLLRNSIKVHLIGNNLKCSCETFDFLNWMHNSKKIRFVEKGDYTCSFESNATVTFENLDKILQGLEKKCSSYSLIILLMTSLIIMIMTVTTSRILYRFRWKIRYMYYVAKEKYKAETNRNEFDGQDAFRFDAFISYADEDRAYVIDLVKSLEKDYHLKLCIHNRDFIPGTGIADNITNAIHCSKQTVCFITQSFLDSYWCMFELNMARMEAVYSRNGQNVLFLVAFDRGIMKRLPLQLMDLVSSRSYLSFPEEEDLTVDSGAILAFRAKLGETLASY